MWLIEHSPVNSLTELSIFLPLFPPIQALEAAIENIADTNSLANLLQSLGCKHIYYHVQENMFDVAYRFANFLCTLIKFSD